MEQLVSSVPELVVDLLKLLLEQFRAEWNIGVPETGGVIQL